MYHPNIIQLFEIIETAKYYFFVMEFAQKGDLTDFIESRLKLTEVVAQKFFS